ncbi:MFS transporter [Candidatus Leptofilum sp.]|uniref:MFS transporter n=1 Tax=Candidatus Leptofilum sp. TaxID=3241576 RepID=UPI003B5BA18D
MTVKHTPQSMRTFFIIWAGQIISIIGSGLTGFGLAVWIFEQTGAATPFALTVMFANIPQILLSPFAGALVDRWNRRQVMIAADTGSALITLGALLLLTMGQLAVWHIYLIAALHSALAAFQEPAYSASITMLVPKKDLTRANGLMQMGQAVQMLLAPLLAGILFVAIGLNGIILIDFVTFLFAVGTLLLVHIPQPKKSEQDEAEKAKQSLWQEASFGWRYLRDKGGLLGLLFFFALVNFFLNFSAVLLGPMILSFGTAAGLGTVQMVGGLGMLIGSIAMSAWGGPERRITAVIGFIMLAALGLFIAGLQSTVWIVAVGMFVLMFSVPFGSGISQAIFQSKVEPEVQGRVFSIRSMISRSMMPLAFLLAGPLADQVFEPLLREGGTLAEGVIGQIVGIGPGRGIGLLFLISAVVLWIASVAAFTNPRIRNIETELPDVVIEEEDVSDESVLGLETA